MNKILQKLDCFLHGEHHRSVSSLPSSYLTNLNGYWTADMSLNLSSSVGFSNIYEIGSYIYHNVFGWRTLDI